MAEGNNKAMDPTSRSKEEINDNISDDEIKRVFTSSDDFVEKQDENNERGSDVNERGNDFSNASINNHEHRGDNATPKKKIPITAKLPANPQDNIHVLSAGCSEAMDKSSMVIKSRDISHLDHNTRGQHVASAYLLTSGPKFDNLTHLEKLSQLEKNNDTVTNQPNHGFCHGHQNYPQNDDEDKPEAASIACGEQGGPGRAFSADDDQQDCFSNTDNNQPEAAFTTDDENVRGSNVQPTVPSARVPFSGLDGGTLELLQWEDLRNSGESDQTEVDVDTGNGAVENQHHQTDWGQAMAPQVLLGHDAGGNEPVIDLSTRVDTGDPRDQPWNPGFNLLVGVEPQFPRRLPVHVEPVVHLRTGCVDLTDSTDLTWNHGMGQDLGPRFSPRFPMVVVHYGYPHEDESVVDLGSRAVDRTDRSDELQEIGDAEEPQEVRVADEVMIYSEAEDMESGNNLSGQVAVTGDRAQNNQDDTAVMTRILLELARNPPRSGSERLHMILALLRLVQQQPDCRRPFSAPCATNTPPSTASSTPSPSPPSASATQDVCDLATCQCNAQVLIFNCRHRVCYNHFHGSYPYCAVCQRIVSYFYRLLLGRERDVFRGGEGDRDK